MFHIDDLLFAGTRQTVTEIVSELERDLEPKSSEVTTKPTRFLGRTLVRTEEEHNFGVDASYVEDMLEEINMTALQSTPTLRWAMRRSYQQTSRWRLASSLKNCCGIDRAGLRSAMGEAPSSLGRASDTDMRNSKSILRYLRGRNHDSAAGDADWVGDVGRFSVSGTASWVKGRFGWYPITAPGKKQSTIALSSGEAELVAALSGACEGMGLRQQAELVAKVWKQCRGDATNIATDAML